MRLFYHIDPHECTNICARCDELKLNVRLLAFERRVLTLTRTDYSPASIDYGMTTLLYNPKMKP